MSNFQSFVEKIDPVDEPNYNCTKENGAPDIAGWNEKYYSPVCREWYNDTKTEFEAHPEAPRGIMTNLYTFAGEPVIGLTSCAPVQEFSGNSAKFRGAMCLDIAPMGELN